MLLMLTSYYFIALKYSQEAFLELATINATDIKQSNESSSIVEILQSRDFKDRAPAIIIKQISQHNNLTFHLYVKENRVLAHNLPRDITIDSLIRNEADISLTFVDGNNKVNLTVNEQEKIVHLFEGGLIISLPNQIFSSRYVKQSDSISIEQKLFMALLLLAVFAISMTWIFTRFYLKPIESLSDGFERLAGGQQKITVPVIRPDELGRLATHFNQTVEKLDALQQAQKDMTTDIAHELRTPLNNMQVNIEAIIDGVIKIDAETFESLLSHIKGLSHLVNDLQDLSLAQAGQLNFNNEPVETGSVIDRNFKVFDEAMKLKMITFKITDCQPCNLYIDPMRLNQILFNVLENARKYTPSNGDVELFGQQIESRYVFGISNSNSGFGVPQVDKGKMFNRLFRDKHQQEGIIPGHGLGLTIANKLTHLMGGTIHVEDSTHGGLVIVIAFRL